MKEQDIEMSDSHKLVELIEVFKDSFERELAERWSQIKIDPQQTEVCNVAAAISGFQVNVACHFAQSVQMWNPLCAPILLRTMADNYITFSWISCDPVDRSRKYILYGLGQEKLEIEHRIAVAKSENRDPDEDPVIESKRDWLNSQRFSFLTEVNIGSWSGIDTRRMAEEAGCLDFYRYVYSPFSAATHATWPHTSKSSVTMCQNPLHRGHYLPHVGTFTPDLEHLYLCGKYVNKLLVKLGETFDAPSSFCAFDYVGEWLSNSHVSEN